jgi:hypothetical protein
MVTQIQTVNSKIRTLRLDKTTLQNPEAANTAEL